MEATASAGAVDRGAKKSLVSPAGFPPVVATVLSGLGASLSHHFGAVCAIGIPPSSGSVVLGLGADSFVVFFTGVGLAISSTLPASASSPSRSSLSPPRNAASARISTVSFFLFFDPGSCLSSSAAPFSLFTNPNRSRGSTPSPSPATFSAARDAATSELKNSRGRLNLSVGPASPPDPSDAPASASPPDDSPSSPSRTISIPSVSPPRRPRPSRGGLGFQNTMPGSWYSLRRVRSDASSGNGVQSGDDAIGVV